MKIWSNKEHNKLEALTHKFGRLIKQLPQRKYN